MYQGLEYDIAVLKGHFVIKYIFSASFTLETFSNKMSWFRDLKISYYSFVSVLVNFAFAFKSNMVTWLKFEPFFNTSSEVANTLTTCMEGTQLTKTVLIGFPYSIVEFMTWF